jgi:hypothetical protein
MGGFFIQHLSRHGPRFIVGTFQCRNHAAGVIAPVATLTCHFFELLALNIRALAVRMIELCRQALLINLIGLVSLLQPPLAAAFSVAVALAAVTGAADKKDSAASRTSANPLAKLDWQGVAVFLKAGLDNGRQSWQACPRVRSCLNQFRTFRAPTAAYGCGPCSFLPLEMKINQLKRNQTQLKRKNS